MKNHLHNITGILLLDKPIELSSNGALQIVKRLFKAKKAGHTGSLDPLATGMLPLCFGEATKFAQFLLDTDKCYSVTAKLGVKTATGDVEGEVIAEEPVPTFTAADIEAVLAGFRGKIEQIPSMYSAIKYQGRPLYELARAGISVEREKRPVTIYKLDLLRQGNDELDFIVSCSKGTYIRTLIEDIGERLGCGAHVIKLRRLSVGHYAEEKMVKLPDLEALAQQGDMAKLYSLLLPVESIFVGLPTLQIHENMVRYLRQGQSVLIPQTPTSGFVNLQFKDGNFVGIGEVLPNGKIALRRGVAR